MNRRTPPRTLRQGDLFAEARAGSEHVVGAREHSVAPGVAGVVAERPESATRDDLLIRASAGAGKTFRLAHRYIELLRRCPAERILAVTFTRKAASEIFERVLSRLAEAALDAEKRNELARFLGPPTLTREECLALLQSLTSGLHRVRVGTLDSFFARLGKSFALDVGLPPQWRIADAHEDQSQKLKAIDAVFREGDSGDLRRLLHLLARGDVPRSVTRLLEEAVCKFHEVSRLTSPTAWRRIPDVPLCASEELARAMDELAAYDLSNRTAFQNAREADLKRFLSADWETFLSKGLAGSILKEEPKYWNSPIPDDLRAIYEPLVRHVKALLLKIWSDQNGATCDLLARYREARRNLMAESQSLRFDDVTVMLAEGMASVRSVALVHRLDAAIDHLLLDEFQDTSLVQWRVLAPFVQSVTTRRESSFFCVGDVKQAIYGWRGGVAALFDKVAAEVAGARIEEVHKSFRSAPVVIDAVNRVFQNLDRHTRLGDLHADVLEWQTGFPLHQTARAELAGHVTLETSALETGNIDLKRLSCFARAADLAAKFVTEAPEATIGILTRTNQSVARLMYDLGQRGVLASEEGGVPLINSASVQLIQSALRFGDHPGHSIARFHIAHSPLGDHYGVRASLSKAEAQAAALRIRSDLLERGYESCIAMWAELLRPLCNAREWSRLQRLREIAARSAATHSLRPRDFAEIIQQESVEDPSGSQVRVMTLHRAKGLEFDIVILPDLEKPLHDTPDYNACGPDPAGIPDTVFVHRSKLMVGLLTPDLQRAFEHQRRVDVHESLCCLYVAMTRARHALHMIIAGDREKHTLTLSPAGLLRAALSDRSDAPPATVLFEDGDPDWTAGLRVNAGIEGDGLASVAAAPPRIELAAIGVERARGRETLSPSHAKTRFVRGSQLLSRQRTATARRGTLWHAWCQSLRWIDETPPDPELLRRIAQRLQADSLIERELPGFLAALRQPQIAEILAKSYYGEGGPGLAAAVHQKYVGVRLEPECASERPFTVIDDGRHLSGSIDRLVLLSADGIPVAADVIDYKTDEDGESSTARSGYFEQLRFYQRAVSQAHGIEPSAITARLVWLATGTVEPLPAA